MKPGYKVPSMSEIENLEWNGFKVCSTFSGGGGSCLGYRMAGYNVLYANEFIPEAQNTYKANHKKSHLDTRDIRTVSPEDILRITGLKKGELDIFDGSPPCATFSTAGKREKSWGVVKEYSDTKQRVDDLFFEYTRILKGLMPKVFIAENVSGLIKGTAKGYFKLILNELKDCGYNVKAAVLNSKYLGVPQSRERLIFIGVRNDLGLEPVFPKPKDFYYTFLDAIPEKEIKGEHYPLNKSGKLYQAYLTTKQGDTFEKAWETLYGKKSAFTHRKLSYKEPSPTLLQGAQDKYHPEFPRSLTINEAKRIQSLPDDFILTGNFTKQWERIGRMVPPIMMKEISDTIRREVLCKIK